MKTHEVTPDFMLEGGDIVAVIASIKAHQQARERLQYDDVLDTELLEYQVVTQEIIIAEDRVVGKILREMDLPSIRRINHLFPKVDKYRRL